MKVIVFIVIEFVRFVRNLIISGAVCRYFPSCSVYAKESIQKYGVFKGILLGAKRILRCHPFAKGGFDPVK